MRCIRAVKSLRAREGSALEAVALYTDVDRDAPFVRHADRALRARRRRRAPWRAYLDRDGLLAALRAAGADAVWPGWGFLAEDPAFAERCAADGHPLPRPAARARCATLGDKIAAKRARRAARRARCSPWSGGAVDGRGRGAAARPSASATRSS